MLKFLRIERPTSATRRSSWAAASITCWTRCTLEAKQVTMIRPSQRANCLEQRRADRSTPTARPRGGRRWSSRRRGRARPREPSSASRAMSAGRAVDRGLVELVVAGDQRSAPSVGVQRDGARVGDRVRHVDHLDLERAGLDAARRRRAPRAARRGACAPRASSAPARSSAGRRRSPAACRSRAARTGSAPTWSSCAVGEHDRLDVVGALAQVGEVGQHEVDAEHLGGREHQPGVDDDDPAVALDDGHVLADLAQPPERAGCGSSRSSRARSRAGPARSSVARIDGALVVGRRRPSAAARARRSRRAARAPSSPRSAGGATVIAA